LIYNAAVLSRLNGASWNVQPNIRENYQTLVSCSIALVILAALVVVAVILLGVLGIPENVFHPL
jgi:hypothetical protein